MLDSDQRQVEAMEWIGSCPGEYNLAAGQTIAKGWPTQRPVSEGGL